jgi:hypothetical protein
MSKVSKSILILAVTLVVLKYYAFWLEGFSGMFIILLMVISGFILLGLLLYQTVVFFKTRDKKLLISLFIGIIATLVVVFEPVENLIEKFKSPVVLTGYCEHTVTFVSLTLRQDKTFEYNAGAFLSREMYYGNYKITGDTLALDFGANQPAYLKNKLIFKEKGLQEIEASNGHRHFFKLVLNELKK